VPTPNAQEFQGIPAPVGASPSPFQDTG